MLTNKKGGMTLIELIIACGILLIFFSIISSIFMWEFKMITKGMKYNKLRDKLITSSNVISTELRASIEIYTPDAKLDPAFGGTNNIEFIRYDENRGVGGKNRIKFYYDSNSKSLIREEVFTGSKTTLLEDITQTDINFKYVDMISKNSIIYILHYKDPINPEIEDSLDLRVSLRNIIPVFYKDNLNINILPKALGY